MKVTVEIPELGNFRHIAEFGDISAIKPDRDVLEAVRHAAQPTKYMILKTLAERGGRARYMDIGSAVPSGALNAHLRALRYLGLVDKASDGEYVLTILGTVVFALISAAFVARGQ